jgi:hypothetical protein
MVDAHGSRRSKTWRTAILCVAGAFARLFATRCIRTAPSEGAYFQVGRLQESVRLTDDGDVVPFLGDGGRRIGAGYVVLKVVSERHVGLLIEARCEPWLAFVKCTVRQPHGDRPSVANVGRSAEWGQ